MALIKCNKCGQDVSEKAIHCPHCGTKKFQENVKKEKNNTLRNLFFVISIIISIILSICAFIVLVDSIINIPKLNYPLTSILPIIICLLAISFSIVFIVGMNKYRKRKNSKKILIISLVLFTTMLITYFICAPINRMIQTNNIGYRNQGIGTYSVKGLSYNVPKKWRTVEIDGGYYHYPYVENSDGLLYVYAEYNSAYDETLYDDMDEYYEEFIEGMKSSDSTGYFKVLSQESTKIIEKDAFKLKYKTLINDIYLDCEQYMLLDLETNTMYVFTFGIKDSIPSDMKETFDNIIDSIRER